MTRRELIFSAVATAAAFGLPGRLAVTGLAHAQGVEGFRRYKVGSIEVTALSDGVWEKAHDPAFIANASVEETKAALTAAGFTSEFVPIPFTPNLLKVGDKLVLVDTGTGSGQTGGPKAGQLMQNLAAVRVDPAAISAVIISHYHSDHIFGLTTKGPENRPIFPNAEVLVPSVEHRYWMDPAVIGQLPEARRGLARRIQEVFPLFKDRVRQFEWNTEIYPGIRAVDAPGHTPGHTAFHVSSGGEDLLILSDVTNIPALFARNPGWHAAFDQDPKQAEATRRALLERAASDKLLVTGYHFPFPAAGRLAKDGSGYSLSLV